MRHFLAFFFAAICTAAGAAGLKARVLVDFEDPAAIRLSSGQAQAAIVAAAGGHALEIKTDAKADWPSVNIEPASGPWDLTGFDGCEIDVVNPEDVPVRVLLCINNPGSDGMNRCNCESATIDARGKGTVVVPFGMWHGESGKTLDLKKIVSMQVLLDKPGRAHRFLVDNLRAVVRPKIDMVAIQADPFFRQMTSPFGRGVNLGNGLDAPKEGDWGVRLEESYFEAIRQAGFDSVRVPIRWSAHAEHTAPYRIDPAFFERVDWVVRQSVSRKLTPILNVHHYEELMREPDKHRERFVALWRQIAERYKDAPAEVAFELCNEPCDKLSADKWNAMAAEAIAVVRRSNPTRRIVVGPVDWNAIKALPRLTLPEADRNLVVTVHYYAPFEFTHQGASWAGPQAQKWLGRKWTGSEAERAAVTADFAQALAWAVEHHRPLYLGEFGAFSTADMDSRVRWTRFIADEAVKRKMSIAYWEFCSGFGLYDPQTHEWREGLKNAVLGK